MLVAGYAIITALWMYSEALISTGITVSFFGGFTAGFIGWIGLSIASLAKIPFLQRFSDPGLRRFAFILSSIALLSASLLIIRDFKGVQGYVIFYSLVSIAYGLTSTAFFATTLSDVDYRDWRDTIVSSSLATYGLTLIVLLAWSVLDLNLGAPLALMSSMVVAFIALNLRPSLFPSIELKTMEVITDILSFRRRPEYYVYWHLEVVKLAVILGGLGALKVTLLSTTMHQLGVYTIAALSAGSLAGSIIASYMIRPRMAMIITLTATSIILVAGNKLIGLAMVGLAIAYSHLTIIISVLENRPKAVYKAALIITVATAIGAAIVGITSLANPSIAAKIITPLTLITLATSIALTGKTKWE